MSYIDLHLHSTYSDGTLTPLQLVQEAKAIGLKAISLTDHDTTEGVEKIITHGAAYGIETLTGVELSAHFDNLSIHILGYGLRHKDPSLLRRLEAIQQARNIRNEKIICRLNELGIQTSKEDILRFSRTGQTGRPHFAQYLVEKKVVATFDEAFSSYLGQNGSAYVPRKILSAVDGIRYIIEAGGIAVLAHPAAIDHSMDSIPHLVESLIDLGLGGVEVYYPTHTKSMRKTLLDLCRKYDLIATGGSDFHGYKCSVNSLGKTGKNKKLPYGIFEIIKNRIEPTTKATTRDI